MKIVKKGVLFLVIMTLVIITLNYVVPNPYKNQKNEVETIIENPTKYKSFAFGRSHAASLCYDYYNKKGVNFALGGRDLASIDYLVRFLIPRCDSLKEVIVFISYTSLYFDNTAMSAGNLNDARKELYYTIPSVYPIDWWDINNFIFGKILTFVQADHGQKILKDLQKGRNVTEDKKDFNEVEMIKSGIDQTRRDVLDKQSALLYNKDIVRENTNRLRDIINYCKECNIKIYLVQAPYYHTYIENVPDEIVKEVNKVVKGLSSSAHIPYYDFSKDDRFCNDISLFMNSDHLNFNGKKKFTEILNKTIK